MANALAKRAGSLSFVVVLLAACSVQPPVPSLRSSASTSTPLPASALAPAPPTEVSASLRRHGVTFVPLNPDELAAVAVTSAQAELIARAATKAVRAEGCIFLGSLKSLVMSSAGQVIGSEQVPTYLVQFLTARPEDTGTDHIELIVINAVTGVRQGGYGGGPRPYGIAGTTCGAS
jgi:hypothetical protein